MEEVCLLIKWDTKGFRTTVSRILIFKLIHLPNHL
jgi:hypothetical protein